MSLINPSPDTFQPWVLNLGIMTTGSDPTEVAVFTVTLEDADEPAFHHLSEDPHEAKKVADWFNWAKLTENEYLQHGSRLVELVQENDALGFEKYISKLRRPSIIHRIKNLFHSGRS